MADLKISQLTGATTPLGGTEELPLVQSSTTKKVTVANLTAGRAVSVASLTATGNIGGANINVADTNWLGWGNYATRFTGAGGGPLNVITNSITAGTWDASQNYTAYGNLIQGTAAKGVNFTANTPAAGMTSQLLNWYEEGTFTPTIGGDSVAGTQTYSVQFGRYTRIGNRVYFNLRIVLTAKDAATAGNLIIGGLPFASNATAHNFHSLAVGNVGLITLTAGYTQIEAHIEPNFTYMYLGQLGSGVAYSYLQAAAFAATTRIAVSGHYMV